MNNLNSILIEGVVQDIRSYTTDDGKEIIDLAIVITSRNEEEHYTHSFKVLVQITSKKLINEIKGKIKHDQAVRVVGKLEKAYSYLYIRAEYLKFINVPLKEEAI